MTLGAFRLSVATALSVAAFPALSAYALPLATVDMRQDSRPAPSEASPALGERLDALAGLLNGGGDFETYFAAGFRDQVPEARFREQAAQVVAALGPAVAIEEIATIGRFEATIVIGFERGIVRGRISVEPAAPRRVNGLWFSGTELRDDNSESLDADFRALPGSAGYGIYRLGGSAPARVMELNGDRAAPVASGFKLWVLAEAARQVRAGRRAWGDTISLGERSLPGGVLQTWPEGAPVTLHTLAVQMISISDNTATDTLMDALGRAEVDALVRISGTANADATLPLLTTMEAFRLKHPDNAALIDDWAKLSPDLRRKRLADHSDRLRATPVSPAMFGDRALSPQIGWFASPVDIARLLDLIRTTNDPDMLAILTVNPGGDAARFAYLGFKGGSEPGVVSASYLVRTKAGQWMAVAGNWHRDDGAVDQARFFALMNRALTLASQPENAPRR